GGDHGPHGQVELSADDDEVLTDRDHGDRRDPLEEPHERTGLGEGRVERDDGDEDDDEEDEDDALRVDRTRGQCRDPITGPAPRLGGLDCHRRAPPRSGLGSPSDPGPRSGLAAGSAAALGPAPAPEAPAPAAVGPDPAAEATAPEAPVGPASANRMRRAISRRRA